MPVKAYAETVLKEDPKLIERRYRTGKVVHRSFAYAGGQQEVVTFQRMTRTEAKEAHLKHQEEFTGKVAGGKKPENPPRNVAELLDRVLGTADEDGKRGILGEEAELGERSMDHVNNMRASGVKRIKPHYIAKLKPRDLNDENCTAWLRWLKREGQRLDLSYWTMHGTVTALQSSLRVARHKGWIRHDPFAAVDRKHFPLQKARNKTKALSNEQGLAIVAAAQTPEFRDATDTDWTNLIIVARGKPDRSSEVVGLHWRDWNPKTGRLAVNGAMDPSQKVGEPVVYKGPKNGEEGKRNPPVFAEVRAAIVRQREIEFAKGLGKPDDLMFTKADKSPMTRHDLLRAVKRAAKIAGLGNVTARQLRTSWITAAAHAGMPSVEISTFSGNSPAVIERFYVRPIETEKQQEINIEQMTAYGFTGEEAV